MAEQTPLGGWPEDTATADGVESEGRAYRAAFEQALRYLGQREYSVQELVTRLKGKGVDPATAALVVDDLRGRGLQSDARFAEAFVHSRINRGQGPIRIRQELSQRGIDDDVADEVLTQSAEYWLDLAREARVKKFGDDAPDGRDDWNRQARFLARRGFPSDLVYRVLGAGAD